MSSFQLRVSSMIKASLISDIAAMPLHWIYDQSVVANKIGNENAAFFPTPSCPYYEYPPGVFSPYGDESLPLLRSIADVGEFDRDQAASTMHSFFSTYADIGDKGYAGRLNHAPKTFVAARDSGKSWDECSQEDTQANGIAKVALIVARYAGKPELSAKIESMVRILQNTQISVDSSLLLGKLLERILLTSQSPSEAMDGLLAEPDSLNDYQRNVLRFVSSDAMIQEWVAFSEALNAAPADPADGMRGMRVKGQLLTQLLNTMDLAAAIDSAPLSAKDKEFVAAYGTFNKSVLDAGVEVPVLKIASAIGLSCNLPSALIVSLLIMRKAATLAEAAHFNIAAGGDSCSRALVVGAAYGAASASAIPAAWEAKVNHKLWQEITSAADKIAADNN